MRRILPGILSFLIAVAAGAAPADFSADFTGRSLRLDLYHSGTAGEEHLALRRSRLEGDWPGSRTQLLDPTAYGKYFFEVADLATQRVLYSRGYSSIYGEWETTGEAAAGTWRTYPESLRLPEPKRPFQVRLRKRGADGGFREIWSLTVDPGSRFVDRSALPPQTAWTVFENGPSASKVDLVVLGDGYTAGELSKFRDDTRRVVDHLFAAEPFASRRTDFNVRAVDTPAAESGISRPRSGLFRASPLGTSYNALDSERYILSSDEHGWREIAATVPYDFVIILVNSEKYGGGGIYQLYTTAAVDSAFAPYLIAHEFGHSFAALGDEYYTSDVAYEDFQGDAVEPVEPNLTADPESPKWAHMVTAGTPLPTPWGKEAYETESRASQAERRALRAAGAAETELEELFYGERALFTEMLGAEEHAGAVGAFEGGGYQAQGIWRPSVDCIMFTRNEVGYCPVCLTAVERIIDLYAR